MEKEPKSTKKTQQVEGKRPYTPPAIIYTTQITTRAGSPLGIDKDIDSIDPARLFND